MSSIDLLCAEFLGTKPDCDISLDLSKNHKHNGAKQVTTEADFSQEVVLDSISNRNQREKFTKQIICIMCYELIFIAFLISIVLVVQLFNALAPKISLNIPPIFLSVSLGILYIYLYKFTHCLPDCRVSCKFIHLKKHTVSTAYITRLFLTILLIFLFNVLPRENHEIYYKPIILTDNIIHMILYTALAVFAKTTFLAHYIIKGLYDALNQKNNKSKISKSICSTNSK